MPTVAVTLRLLGFALALGACSGSTKTTSLKTTSFKDEGSLCLRSQADGTLRVTVTFPTCLSSNCDRLINNKCEVTPSGNELRITSSATVESEGTVCNSDCGIPTATCLSAPLEPAEYVVSHGDNSATVMLPQQAQLLFGSGQDAFFCT